MYKRQNQSNACLEDAIVMDFGPELDFGTHALLSQFFAHGPGNGASEMVKVAGKVLSSSVKDRKQWPCQENRQL